MRASTVMRDELLEMQQQAQLLNSNSCGKEMSECRFLPTIGGFFSLLLS